MAFNKKEFIDFIIENGVIGFYEEPVRLKSGRLSPYYINWRNVAEDVYLIDRLSDFILEFCRDNNIKPDCFYGVPEGATKIGIITQYKYAKRDPNLAKGKYPLPMGRGKIKEHGIEKDRFFLGIPKGKTAIIEDVVTTGGSLLSEIEKLGKFGIEICAVLVLTDRLELRDDGKTVREIIEELGYKYYSLSDSKEIIEEYLRGKKLKKEILEMLKEYIREYTVFRLDIGNKLNSLCLDRMANVKK